MLLPNPCICQHCEQPLLNNWPMLVRYWYLFAPNYTNNILNSRRHLPHQVEEVIRLASQQAEREAELRNAQVGCVGL